MGSYYAKLVNYFCRKNAKPMDKSHDFVEERKKNSKYASKKIPNYLLVKDVEYHGIKGEIISNKNKSNGKIIYYIHGGGFTTGSYIERRQITFYLAKKYGYTVIASNYRLSPENKFPCHVEDVFTFYKEMIKEYDASKIALCGESAGGGLVLSLALKIKDEKIAMPYAIISFSPVTCQYKELPSQNEKRSTDSILGKGYIQAMQNYFIFEKQEDATSYLASPILGDYNGLPKIFISVTDTELLYDDGIELYNKLKKENHDVKLDIQHDVFHAYPVLPFVKEAKITIQNAINYIEGA